MRSDNRSDSVIQVVSHFTHQIQRYHYMLYNYLVPQFLNLPPESPFKSVSQSFILPAAHLSIMSLVTDLAILSLWQDARAALGFSEPSKIFWLQLLSKYIFAGKDYVVDRGNPPSSVFEKKHADIIIKYIKENINSCVLCFVELEFSVPTPTWVESVEDQAWDACKSYSTQNKLPFVYAILCIGTRARLWKYDGRSPPPTHRGFAHYADTHSIDAQELTMGFNAIKAALSNSPPAPDGIPSYLFQPPPPTVKNKVNLSKFAQDGKTYYAWTQEDKGALIEWIGRSKWTLAMTAAGKSHLQNLEYGVWAKDCDDIRAAVEELGAAAK